MSTTQVPLRDTTPRLPVLPVDAFALARVSTGSARPVLAVQVDSALLDLAGTAQVLGAASPLLDRATDVVELLEEWDAGLAALTDLVEHVRRLGLSDERVAGQVLSGDLRWFSPLRRPSKILCAAQNYPDHVAEMRGARARGFNASSIDESKDFTGEKATTRPYLFLKAPSAITGPYNDITLPPGTSKIDWEVELAVVIGRAARNVSADRALEHIAGYLTANDVSCRDLLFRPDRERLRSDWLGGKSHDGFAPLGPVFVPRQFVPDHHRLQLTLRVNDQLKQDGSTAHLIYSPDEQIEYAARIMTLEPGDVLSTGTPGGVGQGSDTFLQPGDVVAAEVEGLGVLRNRFVAAGGS